MNRTSALLLSAGALLFIALVLAHGVSSVCATLALAGWGILLVALFHGVPLVVDAVAISVLLPADPSRALWRDSVLARWLGESANSLMPFGQIAGPVVMARQLWRRGVPTQNAIAAITVSTTLQALAQVVFGLMGIGLLGFQTHLHVPNALRRALILASAVLAVIVVAFYLLQRRSLFAPSLRAVSRFWSRHDWSSLLSKAEAIDGAVRNTYRQGLGVPACFCLNLLGWIVGTGEVYLILQLLRAPVSWSIALLLESVGQAIRGAAFAVPGALGVQEGGYLLLAPVAGLAPDTALALSLAKRAREILLGVPGLLMLHVSERA
jgi:putative membrane protein